MKSASSFSAEVLQIDSELVADGIATEIRRIVFEKFRKKGVVVGISGGVDSSVVAALCARALGAKQVLGLLMPEGESAATDESTELGQLLAETLGIPTEFEDITPILEGAGCYRRRDEALQKVIPDYGPGWKSKLVLPSVVDGDQYRIYSVVAVSPSGQDFRARLSPDALLGVVAATNFKQRTRKMLEYYHADRRNFAVAGTPNRLEYDQGFFVKGGDGLADVKPIAHLFKSQVYQLAEHLGIPKEICSRPPTTDTYSLPQSQEEFYFSLPYDKMDLCLWAYDQGVSVDDLGEVLCFSTEQIERVYRDIEGKRRAALYLHHPPVVLESLDGGARSDGS